LFALLPVAFQEVVIQAHARLEVLRKVGRWIWISE
jgi:hypothetical protein